MAEMLLPGTFHRESEFVDGLTGACGPNALSMAWSWAAQKTHTTLETFQFMRSHNLCDSNGVSNIGDLYTAAQALGLNVSDYRPYAEPWPDWHDWFWRHLLDGHGILYETAYGQALVDSISGEGEDAVGLQYHFILVVGCHDGGYSAHAGRDLPAGWWACDGDNYVVGNVLEFYPDNIIAASLPCAALAIAEIPPQGGTGPMPYVFNSNGSATDTATGVHIGPGFATYIKQHNVQQRCILGDTTYGSSGDTFAAFDGGLILYWKSGEAVSDTLGGYVAVALYQLLQSANVQVSNLTQQVNALKAQSGGTSGNNSPQATQAINVLQQLKTLLNSI